MSEVIDISVKELGRQNASLQDSFADADTMLGVIVDCYFGAGINKLDCVYYVSGEVGRRKFLFEQDFMAATIKSTFEVNKEDSRAAKSDFQPFLSKEFI